jgi:hypothetical protein
MDNPSRNDIRRLVKTFGVRADETILAYLDAHPGDEPLQLRVTLEDVTVYGPNPPAEKLTFAVEGEVQRSG